MEDTSAKTLNESLKKRGVKLVAVSKTKPISQIMQIYDQEIKDFGENRPQELAEKYNQMPKDIRWHMIGNLQRNKVKYIAPFVHLIHSVSSEDLLKTINKEGIKNDRKIGVLLQIKIAEEDTKNGLSLSEARDILKNVLSKQYSHIKIRGFMGMASFVNDEEQVKREFQALKIYSNKLATEFNALELVDENYILSMGMSGDYELAIQEGSNMVRIGSLLFGARNYS